jgi:GNAT superfamily N-acetyltransferase
MLTRAYVAGREGFPDDPERLRAYSRHDPGGGAENWIVTWEGTRPVSALRLFYREVTSPAGTFPIAGIGNVGTDPERSGRGLASLVMEAAHERLRREGIGTVVLVTDIPGFYARLGYAPVPQAEIAGARAGGQPVSGWGSEALPVPAVSFLPPEAPAAVQAAHRELASQVPGRVVRTPEYWSRWIQAFKVQTQQPDALRAEGTYLIGRREEGGATYRILEAGGSEAELARLAVRAAGTAVRFVLPDDPLARRTLATLGAEVSPRIRTGIMALSLLPGASGSAALTGFLELDTF